MIPPAPWLLRVVVCDASFGYSAVAKETLVGLLSDGQRQRFQLFDDGSSQSTGLVSDAVLCRSLSSSGILGSLERRW